MGRVVIQTMMNVHRRDRHGKALRAGIPVTDPLVTRKPGLGLLDQNHSICRHSSQDVPNLSRDVLAGDAYQGFTAH